MYQMIPDVPVASPRIACSAGVHRSVTMAVHLAGLLSHTGRKVSLFCPSLQVSGPWDSEMIGDLDYIGYMGHDGHMFFEFIEFIDFVSFQEFQVIQVVQHPIFCLHDGFLMPMFAIFHGKYLFNIFTLYSPYIIYIIYMYRYIIYKS